MDLPILAPKTVAQESFPDAKTSTAHKAFEDLTTELRMPDVPPVTSNS